jgi:hypothetical protein
VWFALSWNDPTAVVIVLIVTQVVKMADASNTEQVSRDVRQNNNKESILEDGTKEVNNADLPGSNTSEPAKGQSSGQEEEQPKRPSKLKQIWAKLGLDPFTLILMFKSV